MSNDKEIHKAVEDLELMLKVQPEYERLRDFALKATTDRQHTDVATHLIYQAIENVAEDMADDFEDMVLENVGHLLAACLNKIQSGEVDIDTMVIPVPRGIIANRFADLAVALAEGTMTYVQAGYEFTTTTCEGPND